MTSRSWNVSKTEDIFSVTDNVTLTRVWAEFSNDEAFITCTDIYGDIQYHFPIHPDDAIGQVLDNAGFYA